jgi:hypothetical protein
MPAFLPALLFAAVALNPAWVPARWAVSDPQSLDLLKDTPINCLLLEQPQWSSAFNKAAVARRITVLGVIHAEGGGDLSQTVRTAAEQSLQGVVLEGDFEAAQAQAAKAVAGEKGLAFLLLPSRRFVDFNGDSLVLGTSQGVWPGIQVVDEKNKDEAHAMPSGGPWIDTNAGFLRYARAMRPQAEFWMGVRPPEKQVLKADRYFGAIADAAMLGARWIVALDSDFSTRLHAGDAAAVRDFKRIGAHLQFYEDARQYRDLPPYGQLAVVQDASNGALLSGSILDMISVKHTPVRPVPGERLTLEALRGASMAVNLDPEILSPEKKEVLKNFARGGGTVLNGPPGWKMPATSKNMLTVDKEEVEKLDDIWKEMNSMIQRRNLGVRLFNVSAMLSFFQASPDGKQAVLHLVNYSGYPVEAVTAHVLGRYKKAWVVTPEGERKAVEAYDVEEGAATGVDIDIVPAFALVTLEQ